MFAYVKNGFFPVVYPIKASPDLATVKFFGANILVLILLLMGENSTDTSVILALLYLII